MSIRLFHVSMTDFPPEQILEPGGWGTALRRYSKSGETFINTDDVKTFFWELPLEGVRKALGKTPSRLACVFTCRRQEEAQSFRDRFRVGGKIYEVEPLSDCPLHFGDYDLITETGDSPYIDHWTSRAVQYWTAAPTGMCEVLVGGPVRIICRRA